jgi:hypothetical protein
MTEMQYRDLLSGAYLWFSRYSTNMELNLATGIEATIFGYSGLTTGPDGYAQSAVTMGPSGYIESNMAASITGDMCFMIWLRNCITPIVLLQTVSGLTITLAEDADGWNIVFDDGVSSPTIYLPGDFSSWAAIVVQRNGNNVQVFKNGDLVNTVALVDSSIEISGTVTLHAGAGSWFDARILPRAITEDAAEYFYDNVIEDNGNAICPMM